MVLELESEDHTPASNQNQAAFAGKFAFCLICRSFAAYPRMARMLTARCRRGGEVKWMKWDQGILVYSAVVVVRQAFDRTVRLYV